MPPSSCSQSHGNPFILPVYSYIYSAMAPRQKNPIKKGDTRCIGGIFLVENVKKEEGDKGKMEI